MTRTLTFEGLTVAAVGLVGADLRSACVVPLVVVPGSVYPLVVTLGAACYRVRLTCTGDDTGPGFAEFSVPLAKVGPVGWFFGLPAWSFKATAYVLHLEDTNQREQPLSHYVSLHVSEADSANFNLCSWRRDNPEVAAILTVAQSCLVELESDRLLHTIVA